MCGSLLAPKAPAMPAAPAPVSAESGVDIIEENPEPQFQAGNEVDEQDAMDASQGTKQLQTHSKTDTGLAIPL
jgi:hypothetical protein